MKPGFSGGDIRVAAQEVGAEIARLHMRPVPKIHQQRTPMRNTYLAFATTWGKGVPEDWVLAHKWLNLSASRTRAGDEREYRARMRDAIASKLGRPGVAVAQSLAVAWRPKPER
jgi:hypothetical protein